MRRSDSKPANSWHYGALIALLACAYACETRDPASVDRAGMVDPAGDRDFYLLSASLDGTPEVRVDAWGSNLTVESDSVLSFDLVIVNRSDRTIYPPFQFEVIDIRPDVVTVLNPDSRGLGSSAIFFLDDHMGADNQLDPDERTTGVRVRFGMPELTSFSIGLRVRGRAPGRESISGVVFDDVVKDGEFDPALEVGLSRRLVELYSAPDADGLGEIVTAVVTDASGRYAFHELASGVYRVAARGPEGWTATTPNPLLLTLVAGPDGGVLPISGVDFGFLDPSPPDSSLLYHANVGAGHEQEDDFINPPSPSDHRYVLGVTEPVYVRAPVGGISGSRVWVNGALVWEIDCDSRDPAYDCRPTGRSVIRFRVELPAGLVEVGRNRIRIVVDGWGEPFWIYSIWRLPITASQ